MPLEEPSYVTRQDLVQFGLLITAIGKSLVEKGLLDKNDIIKELEGYVPNSPSIPFSETIEEMVRGIQAW